MADKSLTTSTVRPWPIKAADPLALLIGGLFAVLGGFRVFALLAMTPDEIAQALGGLLSMAAALRWWLEARQASKVVALADSREAKAHREGLLKPQPRMRERVGAPGEGGAVELPLDDQPTPVDPPGRRVSRTDGASALVVLVALASLAFACVPTASSVRPGLNAIVSRVDVPTLLECGRMLPDYKAAARCLGAEALTQGLRIALDQAHALAERAVEAAGPSGADDMSDTERDELAADLDEALDRLAVEIDATHAEG